MAVFFHRKQFVDNVSPNPFIDFFAPRSQEFNVPQTAGAATSEELNVPLKDPVLAAFLTWLIPGAGHLYQGRTGKGLLFMVCILGVFFQGLYLGGGKVVYASWRAEDRHLAYFCQVGAGLPALPALVQWIRVDVMNSPPLFGGFMAPPKQAFADRDGRGNPAGELSEWERTLGVNFELGTAYTMIAGLLNLLAVFDAFAGPLIISDAARKKKDAIPLRA